MSGISSTYLLQRSDDGILSFVLCVRDGYPNGRRHFSGSVAGAGRNGVLSKSPMRAALQYSPPRREYFVCDACLAGARPKDLLVSSGYEAGLFGMEGRGLYAGGNVGGVYAQVAQNGGWSYGFSQYLNVATYDADNHPSGYKKETLKKAYEEQLKCGESCEVMFKKDGFSEVVERNGEGNHFETNFFGKNEDDAHTHPAVSLNSNASLNGPSNWDGSSVWKRDEYGLNRHYVLLTKTKQLVQYGMIKKPEFMLSAKDRTPIVKTWNINDNVGWKWDFNWKSSW